MVQIGKAAFEIEDGDECGSDPGPATFVLPAITTDAPTLAILNKYAVVVVMLTVVPLLLLSSLLCINCPRYPRRLLLSNFHFCGHSGRSLIFLFRAKSIPSLIYCTESIFLTR